LPFVEKITGGAFGFGEGKGAQTIVVQGFSFSPLICYEVIFSGEVIDKKQRPDLFVNLTNDAWFGKSSGPYQHFDMARMRSIEYGIPLVRVANTGISAFIDPFGRVVDEIGLNEEGIIDVAIIKPLPETIYGKLRSFKF
jgi:apolipoprotein N-acyltransferase